MTTDKQSNIVNWFDKVYKHKRFSYLRPSKAYETYIDILNLKSGDSVLDVGCGPGLFLKLAMQVGCKCSGIDISEQAIKLVRSYAPEADVNLGKAESLPYPNNYFDVVVCIGALERFSNINKALSEQLRVAKKNAKFCFLVRNSKSLVSSSLIKIIEVFKLEVLLKNTKLFDLYSSEAKSLEEWRNIFLSKGFYIEKIIPDQWPLKKITSLLPSFLVKTLVPKIHNGVFPLRYSGEFIFILSAK